MMTFATLGQRSAYLAAANVAARQVVLDRPRPRISAPVLDPAERAKQVLAVLVECGALPA
jgi:hypothetical protein